VLPRFVAKKLHSHKNHLSRSYYVLGSVNTRLIPFATSCSSYTSFIITVTASILRYSVYFCIAAKIESVAATTPGPEAYPVNIVYYSRIGQP
jgi:hypothetical protein